MSNLSKNSTPKLTIVIPCYNEEAVILHTYKALSDKLNSLITQKIISKESFLCFVDDGSKDKTCEILLSLKNANNSIDKAHCHTEGFIPEVSIYVVKFVFYQIYSKKCVNFTNLLINFKISPKNPQTNFHFFEFFAKFCDIIFSA